MFKLNPKKILLREPTLLDVRGNVTFEKRHDTLKRLMQIQPKLIVKGGSTKTNPYKVHYDLVLAERREELEKYRKSVLWSPKYTPWHFKYIFFYPFLWVMFLMWYIRYIAIPKRMLYLKKKFGYVFPELEEKGWLDGWLEDEAEADQDLFKEIENERYLNWTFNDINKNSNGPRMPTVKPHKDFESDKKETASPRALETKERIRTKMEEIYQIRKQQGI
jgi:hypothetical protein